MLFDVIVPIYNVKIEWFERCLESIKAQRFHEYTVWVCDGTPQDNPLTQQYQQILSENYPDFHYVRQTGKGVSQARNQVLDLGSQPFVAFLDADDFWYPDWLFEANKYCSDEMIEDEVILIGTGVGTLEMVSLMKNEKTTISAYYHGYDVNEWEPNYHYYHISKGSIFPSFSIVKRNRIEQIGGFREDMGVAEDTVFYAELCGDYLQTSKVYRVAKIECKVGWKENHDEGSAIGGNQSGLNHNDQQHHNHCIDEAEKYFDRSHCERPEDVSEGWWDTYSKFNRNTVIRLL